MSTHPKAQSTKLSFDSGDAPQVATLGPSPRAVTDAVTKSLVELESDPTNNYFGSHGACSASNLVTRGSL